MIAMESQRGGLTEAEETSLKQHKKISGCDDAVYSASENLEWIAPAEQPVLDDKVNSITLLPNFLGLHETKFTGVRKRKYGKYAAVIRDPILNKRVWLGTFNIAQEASEVYLAKQYEFAEFVKAFQESPASNQLLHDQILLNLCSNSVCAAERSNAGDIGRKPPIIREILGSEWQNMVKLRKDNKKHEITVTNNPKLPGIRRQKNGRYGAEVRDPFRHKQIWLGTFDTVEQASKAVLSKKSEFEKLSLQGNKENKPKRSDQIQLDSCVGVLSSVANNQTLNNASGGSYNKITHDIIGVYKNKYGKYSSEIRNPISKKKIWLGTLDTKKEASRAYQSKKLEFKKLVQEMQDEKEEAIICVEESSCLKANVIRDVKSSEGCNNVTRNAKGKRSLIGIPRQKKVCWGTFDSAEQASEAIFRKNSECEKLSLQENKPKRCDQSNCRSDQLIDSQGKSHSLGAHRRKTGKYTSEITNPITKKKIWLGTFGTAEEASQAYQFKKLEFQKLVEEKQQGGTETVNCEESQPESAGTTLSSEGMDGELYAYQSKKMEMHSSKKAELQSNAPNDESSARENMKEGGQGDEELLTGQWVQLPDDRAVKFSLKLGLPIIDNHGFLLGEFSSLDDLSIPLTEDADEN